MGLSDGRKSFPIGLAVLIQYRECDSQPASHVAVAITLNAKASSLKTECLYVGGDEQCPICASYRSGCQHRHLHRLSRTFVILVYWLIQVVLDSGRYVKAVFHKANNTVCTIGANPRTSQQFSDCGKSL